MTLHEPNITNLHPSEEAQISQMETRVPSEQTNMLNGERPDVFHNEYAQPEDLDRHTEMMAPAVDARVFERQV
ncbi:unnamed protein product [Strongylus vulgaris]|uniref:Uncharacterized protein n=1 Tax=Strongylus vulgaris TaxID=40348 RepID=A0A3P7M0D9_STRVU|nr:unnamed protein product [Strongylus vulgaris]